MSTCWPVRSGIVAVAVNVSSVISSTVFPPIAPIRCTVDFVHMYSDRLFIRHYRSPTVCDFHGERIISSPVSFSRRPGECPAAVILAVAGAPTNENVHVLAGRSGSVAVAVNVSSVISSTVFSPIAPSFRCTVDFVHMYSDRLFIRHCRSPTVCDFHGERIISRSVSFSRCPGECSCCSDTCSCRCSYQRECPRVRPVNPDRLLLL